MQAVLANMESLVFRSVWLCAKPTLFSFAKFTHEEVATMKATLKDQMKSKGKPPLLAAPKSPLAFSFKKLRNLNVVSAQEAEAAQQKIQDFLGEIKTWLKDNVPALAESLNLPNGQYKMVEESVREFHSQVVEAVNSLPTEPDRAKARIMIMDAMATCFPSSNGRGDNLIADVGLAIGYLRSASNEELRNGRSANLPVTREDGHGWRATALTSSQPDAKRIVGGLRRRSEATRFARRAAEEKERTELHKGTTGNLNDVLGAGGTATFWVPLHEGHAGRRVRSSTVKVEVKDDKIHPIGAVGGLGYLFGRMVEEEVSLPLNAIKDEKIALPKRVSDEHFRLLLNLRDAVRRGLAEAGRREEKSAAVEAMRKKATTSAADFTIENKGGICHLFRPHWELTEGPLAGRRVDLHLLVERDGNGIEAPIRVLEVLPKETEPYFTAYRENTTPESGTNGLPFANLDILGAFLRVCHSVISSSLPRGEDTGTNAAGAEKQAAEATTT